MKRDDGFYLSLEASWSLLILLIIVSSMAFSIPVSPGKELNRLQKMNDLLRVWALGGTIDRVSLIRDTNALFPSDAFVISVGGAVVYESYHKKSAIGHQYVVSGDVFVFPGRWEEITLAVYE